MVVWLYSSSAAPVLAVPTAVLQSMLLPRLVSLVTITCVTLASSTVWAASAAIGAIVKTTHAMSSSAVIRRMP